MKRTLKISAVLTALFTATMAMAQVQPASFPHSNTSGAPHHGPDSKNTTRAEVLAQVAQRFDAVDANKDGVLSQVEKQAAREERKQKMHDKRLRHQDAKLERGAGGQAHRRGPPPAGHGVPPPKHGEAGHDHHIHHGQTPPGADLNGSHNGPQPGGPVHGFRAPKGPAPGTETH